MASVFDVAAFIRPRIAVEDCNLKLQKLVYYSQAWSAAWTGEGLFESPIQAWKYGPVSPELYASEKQGTGVTLGDSFNLTLTQKRIVEAVLAYYGQLSAGILVSLTHSEEPWAQARGQLPEGEHCAEVIPLESMRRFYRRQNKGPLAPQPMNHKARVAAAIDAVAKRHHESLRLLAQ